MSRYALEFGADGLYSHATTPLSRKNPDESWTCPKSRGVATRLIVAVEVVLTSTA